MIVVPEGVRASRTRLGGAFDGWGHTKLYFMAGFKQIGGVVPVYSNSEFDSILTEKNLVLKAEQRRREERLFKRIKDGSN